MLEIKHVRRRARRLFRYLSLNSAVTLSEK